jgi:hypothetical protein
MTAAEAKRIIRPDTTVEADVLTATLRDGVESVKTTIRKGRN